ncbi:recombinase family protein [Plasticicumulans acidivorans]|uniref:recombinase family protein n=1 Tax=Plasticicumulans acidivorans TaxID=886464 RepID=UPI000D70ACF5|nr:recombinase family protein [Plasticicumulans acidivorans]
MNLEQYIRSFINDQDAKRIQLTLEHFAAEQGVEISSHYVETRTGSKINSLQLRRLLHESRSNDVLLLESVRMLARLSDADWALLRAAVLRGLRIVAMDVPASFDTLYRHNAEARVDAMSNMLVDVIAAVARKDRQDRQQRQAEGIARARATGAYRGRQPDHERQARVRALAGEGLSMAEIARQTGYSHTQVSRILSKAQDD